MKLHWYQSEAVSKTWRWLSNNEGNPCIVLPTGAGKTFVMAQMILDATKQGKRVLMTTHASELLSQLEEKLSMFGVQNVGVYSAGKDRYDTKNRVVLGGIQSIYNKAEPLGHRDLIFVDESHRINPRSETTQYGQLFAAFPSARIVGLTATPYRLGSGLICDHDAWLNEISYEVSVKELIAGGFLCSLRSKWIDGIDSKALTITSTGDFAEGEMQSAFMAKIREITKDMNQRCKDRKSVIVFTAGVDQAIAVREILYDACGEGACDIVTGDTPEAQRREIFDDFRTGLLKYLVNCNCLTEGFDARNVDCVVLQRATVSPGLYYQMAGRGLRTLEGKTDCLVLDYGENIARHGPIDAINPGSKKKSNRKDLDAPVKACPNCQEALPISMKVCPNCDHIFETEKGKNLETRPSDQSIVSDDNPKEDKYIPVFAVEVDLHIKKETGARSIMISYLEKNKFNPIVVQYLSVEGSEGARKVAYFTWIKFKTKMPLPTNASDGVEILREFFRMNPDRVPSGVEIEPQKKNPRWMQVKSLSFAKKYRLQLQFEQPQIEVQL